LERSDPFDMKIHVINDHTEFSSVFPDLSIGRQENIPPVIYHILKLKSGTVEQSEMESGMKIILENLTFNENE